MEDKFRQLLPEVIDFLKETDRSDDFVSVLECILNGKINVRNIALNLHLANILTNPLVGKWGTHRHRWTFGLS